MSPEMKIDADAPEWEDLLGALGGMNVKPGVTTRFLDNHDPKAEMVPGLRARIELNEGKKAQIVFEHDDPEELERFVKMVTPEPNPVDVLLDMAKKVGVAFSEAQRHAFMKLRERLEEKVPDPEEATVVKFCPFSKAPCGKHICGLWSFKLDAAGGEHDCAFVVAAEAISRIDAHGIDATNHY